MSIKLDDIKIKVSGDGIEIEKGTDIPVETRGEHDDRYFKFRQWGWSDDEISRMLKNHKDRGRMSDGGYTLI